MAAARAAARASIVSESGNRAGTLQREEFSSLSLTFRYLAGSLGLPFIPIRSLNGSDILTSCNEITPPVVECLKDPFTGEDWLVLKPLLPDVAIAQVQMADEEGNAWILGPRWDNEEQVKASRRTIVITERLVSTETIRRDPDRTLFPASTFPCGPSPLFGAPFLGLPGLRLRPRAHQQYANLSKTPEGLQAVSGEVCVRCQDHWGYLELVGGLAASIALLADPILGY